MVQVRATVNFFDRVAGGIRGAGELFEVSADRAAVLARYGFAEAVETPQTGEKPATAPKPRARRKPAAKRPTTPHTAE